MRRKTHWMHVRPIGSLVMAAVTAAALVAVSAPTASADPAPGKDFCKNGVLLTASGFSNQGECVSTVNHANRRLREAAEACAAKVSAPECQAALAEIASLTENISLNFLANVFDAIQNENPGLLPPGVVDLIDEAITGRCGPLPCPGEAV
jgi:hypothetical protein